MSAHRSSCERAGDSEKWSASVLMRVLLLGLACRIAPPAAGSDPSSSDVDDGEGALEERVDVEAPVLPWSCFGMAPADWVTETASDDTDPVLSDLVDRPDRPEDDTRARTRLRTGDESSFISCSSWSRRPSKADRSSLLSSEWCASSCTPTCWYACGLYLTVALASPAPAPRRTSPEYGGGPSRYGGGISRTCCSMRPDHRRGRRGLQ